MLELDSLDSSPSRDGADYLDPKVEIFDTIFNIYIIYIYKPIARWLHLTFLPTVL